MTTSYYKNIHLSNFFVYYSLDNQVSLSSCMSIKTGLFFLSDFLLFHYSNFWYYRSLLYYVKFLKNREKIKINQEQYTLKIMKILRTTYLGSNFTVSYKKKSVRDLTSFHMFLILLQFLSKYLS